MAQYELGLDWTVEPWNGYRPRALTRCSKRLFLRQEPQKDDCFFVDPDQVDMWPSALKAPRISLGAPLLVEPGRVK